MSGGIQRVSARPGARREDLTKSPGQRAQRAVSSLLLIRIRLELESGRILGARRSL
jgi:hypothetical protein